MLKKKKKQPKTRPVIWRNRIVEHGLVDGDTLVANPKNWRIHPGNQRDAMNGVLDEVGWVQQVLVNKRTGVVVDGHLRVELAIAAKQQVPVAYVDLTEEEEAKILASLDPLASMALTDSAALASLLAGMETNRPLDALLHSLVEQADQTKLTPLPKGDAKNAYSGLVGTPQRSQIKAVLYADQISMFEEALRLTDETNRGEALMIICRQYIDTQKRQHDLPDEAQPAQTSVARA